MWRRRILNSAIVRRVRSWFIRKAVIKNELQYIRRYVTTSYSSKILSWQRRERADREISRNYGSFSYAKMEEAHKWVLAHIPWASDLKVYGRKDFWEITREVLARMRADCESQSSLMMRLMQEAELNDVNIGVAILEGNKTGHAVAIYQFSDTDFWVLDNGYLTTTPIKASEFFTNSQLCKGMRPVAGFNFNTQWAY